MLLKRLNAKTWTNEEVQAECRHSDDIHNIIYTNTLYYILLWTNKIVNMIKKVFLLLLLHNISQFNYIL